MCGTIFSAEERAVGTGVFHRRHGNFHVDNYWNAAISYATNLTFIQLVFGYLVGRVLIVLLFCLDIFVAIFLRRTR